MQACGIVAEYNPFHLGHLLHLNKTKELTNLPVIVVMSSSFMQRGEPGILDKFSRARLAVENGAALVLELPAAFSLRSAQYFAQGAIGLLAATGCITQLSCGAEHPETPFAALASYLCQAEAQLKLRELLQKGFSYARAMEQVLQEAGYFISTMNTSQATLNSPNDILALEYTKALQGTNIKPIYIQRTDAGYNNENVASICSATAIRKAFAAANLSWQAAVPANTKALLSKAAPLPSERLWSLIAYRLRLLNPVAIAQACQCSEGLENRLKQAATCASLEEALKLCSNKRYPTSHIRRLLLQLLLQQKRSIFAQEKPAYLRVLAFDKTGRELLKAMKKTAALPILTKLGKNPEQGQSQAFKEQLELEIAASNLWGLLQSSPLPPNQDYRISPIYIEKN